MTDQNQTDLTHYRVRRQAFFDFHLAHPGNSIHSELVRLACGVEPDEALIRQALDKMDQRLDCADFGLAGILRLLYQFGDSPLLDLTLIDNVRQAVIDFKYWPDEPGVDDMCSWSENHHILFASAAYLVGQLYPDDRFENADHIGREKMALARPRVLRWLDLRFKTGFSEWLSNVYTVEDMAALLNLIDFAQDGEIAQKATMVLDLILLDLALNHFRGTLGSTHGRSYFRHKIDGRREDTASIFHLAFGLNQWRVGNMAAVGLALSSKYKLPAVLYDIANDVNRSRFENRQRMGIRLQDAARWGLDFNRIEDGMVFLSLEAYAHPRTINLMASMLDAYRWWNNRFFEPFKAQQGLLRTAHKLGLLPLLARVMEYDLCRNTREEVNIYTYRTPYYMLSSAVDYRPGYGGDQQHIWQATLGPDAVCFTTDPPNTCRDGATPNYWTGSGTLPRVAQVENVVVAVYKIDTRPGLYVTNHLHFTHAWLPKDKFDEIVEYKSWIFARKGDGYLALRSQRLYRWQTEGEDADKEIVVEGKTNIWLCELGSRQENGEFSQFVDALCAAPLAFRGLKVSYDSPSQGRLQFGWRGPFTRDGQIVNLMDFARYENPYVLAPFPLERIDVRCGGHALQLDWPTTTRIVLDTSD
ncbi:MAG: hypothetical protein JXA89_28445 [Anaerolineae bacterium]|nr:hypothetical protein [Anaerolineae bacterium]